MIKLDNLKNLGYFWGDKNGALEQLNAPIVALSSKTFWDTRPNACKWHTRNS